MGVLDVVDGVLGRLLLRQLDVEVDARGVPPRGEEPARGVHADLGQQLVERDELARALRHGDLDPVAHEPDPGHEDHLDRVAVVAHCGGRVAEPGHRPVVVRAPDVDQAVEPAAELLDDIADVGAEVGPVAVRLADDPVLVIAEGSGSEPERAVVLVQRAGCLQALDCPGDPAVAVERALALPDVEADAEMGQRLLDPRPDPLRRPLPHDLHRVGVCGLRGAPHVVRDLHREVAHVGAPVRLLRQGLAPLDRHHRCAEVPHLGAEIVEVVLAGDRVARRLEHAAQEIAHERAARVADVERPGGVGRDELHVHSPRRRGRDAAPRCGARQDRREDVGERRVGDAQVEEAGRGDRDAPDEGVRTARLRVQLGGERFRDPKGRGPAGPGQLHREVRGEVAVLGVGRTLDFDHRTLDRGDPRQRAGGRRALPGEFEHVAGTRTDRHERGWLERLGHAVSEGRSSPAVGGRST